MSTSESVTDWLADLKGGESIAAKRLWERYVGQLVRLARKRLERSPRRVADEEDVAADAFASFCRGVADNRFASLRDRDDLWQILIVLTERKAIDQIRHDRAEKRGGGIVRGNSALAAHDDSSVPEGFEQIMDAQPTPEFAAQVADQLEQLLTALGDDILRRIAVKKLEGYRNKEIALQLGTSLRGVERQLALIRRIWNREWR